MTAVTRILVAAALGVGLVAGCPAPGGEPGATTDEELRERAEVDRAFARVAQERLAGPGSAQIARYARTGRFTTDPEELGLPGDTFTPGPSAPGERSIGVRLCLRGQAVVLDETTPHGATFALKLAAMDGEVAAGHYTEVPPCDASEGPPSWPGGCTVVRAGLRCPEEAP